MSPMVTAIKLVMKQKGYYTGEDLTIVVKDDKESFDMAARQAAYFDVRMGSEDYNWTEFVYRDKEAEEVVGYVNVTLADMDDNGKPYFVINEIGCRLDIKPSEFCDLLKQAGRPITEDNEFKGFIEAIAA